MQNKHKEELMALADELDRECEESQKIPTFLPEQVSELLAVLFTEIRKTTGRQFGFKCSVSAYANFEMPLFYSLAW